MRDVRNISLHGLRVASYQYHCSLSFAYHAVEGCIIITRVLFCLVMVYSSVDIPLALTPYNSTKVNARYLIYSKQMHAYVPTFLALGVDANVRVKHLPD